MRIVAVAAFVVISCFPLTPAFAAKRAALIIGIGKYEKLTKLDTRSPSLRNLAMQLLGFQNCRNPLTPVVDLH